MAKNCMSDKDNGGPQQEITLQFEIKIKQIGSDGIGKLCITDVSTGNDRQQVDVKLKQITLDNDNRELGVCGASIHNDIPSGNERKLYVGGLSRNIRPKDLRKYFSAYGEIETVKFDRDPTTGIKKNFAFIVFSEADSVEKVLSKETHIIKEKKVLTRKNISNPETIFVGGAIHLLSENDILTFFSKFGTILEFNMFPDKKSKKKKPYYFITFESEEVVQEILESPTKVINGKEVRVGRAYSLIAAESECVSEKRGEGVLVRCGEGAARESSGRNGKTGRFYQATSTSNHTINRNSEACMDTNNETYVKTKNVIPNNTETVPGTIYVGCLTSEHTESVLRKYFSRCGKIINLNIIDQEYPRKRRYCYITFKSKRSVNHLVKRPKQLINGKVVTVERAGPQPVYMDRMRDHLFEICSDRESDLVDHAQFDYHSDGYGNYEDFESFENYGNYDHYGNYQNYGNDGNYGNFQNYGDDGHYGNNQNYGSDVNYGNYQNYENDGNNGNDQHYGNDGNYVNYQICGNNGNFGNYNNPGNHENVGNYECASYGGNGLYYPPYHGYANFTENSACLIYNPPVLYVTPYQI